MDNDLNRWSEIRLLRTEGELKSQRRKLGILDGEIKLYSRKAHDFRREYNRIKNEIMDLSHPKLSSSGVGGIPKNGGSEEIAFRYLLTGMKKQRRGAVHNGQKVSVVQKKRLVVIENAIRLEQAAEHLREISAAAKKIEKLKKSAKEDESTIESTNVRSFADPVSKSAETDHRGDMGNFYLIDARPGANHVETSGGSSHAPSLLPPDPHALEHGVHITVRDPRGTEFLMGVEETYRGDLDITFGSNSLTKRNLFRAEKRKILGNLQAHGYRVRGFKVHNV